MDGTAGNFIKVKSLMRFSIFFTVLCLAAASSAREVGKFAYLNAPEELSGKTVNVDGNMVAMSEELFAKTFQNSSDTVVDTPSVFFIIDNSGSMVSGGGTTRASDPNGYRFTVTKAFIDTLQKNFPKVQVGLAVFGATLFYDPAKAPYIVTCPNQTGGYIPLVQLDSTYAAYGNLTGYEIITRALTMNGNTLATDLRISNFGSNTNITAGFDAAKNAFLSTTTRREKQFVLFFSDGMANIPDSTTNRAECFRFVSGTATPTTLTIFFNQNLIVPPRIDTMTNNIKNNGYSATNPKSAYWGYSVSTQDSLMDFLMNNVFTLISSSSSSIPRSMSVGTASATNYSTTTGSFTFSRLFPLTGTSTTFNMAITYAMYNKSVYIKDTVHSINNFTAVINQGTTLPAALWDVRHWDRDIVFLSNGTVITSASEAMDTIEIRFTSTPGTANYNYTNAKVELTTTGGTSSDKETVVLTKGATYFSAKIKRVFSTSPVEGNRILEQSSGQGSIVAVFRNSEVPVLPLDTLMVTLPSKLTKLAIFDSVVTGDLNHNGLIDNVVVTFDTVVNVTPNMTGNFTVTCNGVTFVVDSIVKIPGTNSYRVYLQEHDTGVPQTSWRPYVSVRDIPNVENINNFLSSDGCAPVLWRVVKQVTGDDRSKDTVYVYLSEKITQPGGAPFNTNNQPIVTLQIWNFDAATRNDTMLTGIPNYARIINDSVLVFGMSNGNDLTSSNWVNIKINQIQDRNGNVTPADNKKVRVVIEGMIVTIKAYPNPSGPTVARSPEYTNLQFTHNPNARTWVDIDHSGIVITIGNLTPPENGGKVKGWLKIYDAVGNSVNWMKSDDIFATLNGQSYMDIYWNGLNSQGMKVAPGIYRAVVYIDYPSFSNVRDVKVVKKIGVGK